MTSRLVPVPPAEEAHLYDPDVPPIVRFAGQWRFLSNYFPAPFWLDGVLWPTQEHYFNAMKSLVPAEQAWVRAAPTAAQAKKRGNDRTGRITLRPDWDASARYQAMTRGVHAKFTAHPGRVAALLSTGTALLVEGTTGWHDNVWGDCRCGRPACAVPGENHLGRTLMWLRHELRAA